MGNPAMMTVASVTSRLNMNTTMTAMLMISRMLLIIPLERMSDTEFT